MQLYRNKILTFRIRCVCCHSNETHALIANTPNSAQLVGTPYHSQSCIRVPAVMWECGEGQSDTHKHTYIHSHTDGPDQYTFRLATPEAKCNNLFVYSHPSWHHHHHRHHMTRGNLLHGPPRYFFYCCLAANDKYEYFFVFMHCRLLSCYQRPI